MIDTFSTLLGTAKKLYEVSEKIKNAEMRSLVADLQNQIADVKTELAAMKEENLRLTDQINTLAKAKESAKKFVHREGMLWRDSPATGENPGPFCPNCKTAGHPHALQRQPEGIPKNFGRYRCSQCKSHF